MKEQERKWVNTVQDIGGLDDEQLRRYYRTFCDSSHQAAKRLAEAQAEQEDVTHTLMAIQVEAFRRGLLAEWPLYRGPFSGCAVCGRDPDERHDHAK